MRIDGPNPTPASAQPASPENKPHTAPPAPAEKVDHVDQHQPDLPATNVVVEIQKGNIMVYKFIDEASGRLIQQIPSEEMLKLSESIVASQLPQDKKEE
jgi:uncharacterized FlaG/YvyC family protein